MTVQVKALELWATKVGAFVLALCSLYGVVKDVFARAPQSPCPTGILQIYSLLMLGVVTAIGFGLLWTAFEQLFDWNFGSGGKRHLPRGWSAIALSLSMTMPLAILPQLYQRVTGLSVVGNPRSHWVGALILIFAGVLTHLLMYGAGSAFPGIRRLVMPPQKNASRRRAVIMEAIFAVVYFGSFVLPYRLIIEGGHISFWGTLFNRTFLPALVFFGGMAFYVTVKPESLREPRYIEIRGFLSALLIMGCLCAGMFG